MQKFVDAFHDAAPAAKSFTEAMETATVLLAKEQAMKSYTQKMDAATQNSPRGMDPILFAEEHRRISKKIRAEFNSYTILGADSSRDDTWRSIEDNLKVLFQRYTEDNVRRLERALVAFANVALLGLALFVLDRMSDWTCDWWSDTCVNLSKVMVIAYVCIFAYVGIHAYFLFNDRGKVGAAIAGGELWKEMMRLVGIYGEVIKSVDYRELP